MTPADRHRRLESYLAAKSGPRHPVTPLAPFSDALAEAVAVAELPDMLAGLETMLAAAVAVSDPGGGHDASLPGSVTGVAAPSAPIPTPHGVTPAVSVPPDCDAPPSPSGGTPTT